MINNQVNTIAREITLIVLGQVKNSDLNKLKLLDVEDLFNLGLQTLLAYWRETLDDCALELETAQQILLESELKELPKSSSIKVRSHLDKCIEKSQFILNNISETFELSRILCSAHQDQIKNEVLKRINLIIKDMDTIDLSLDDVMEGWRLKRLPRIDRDILRLAYVELNNFKLPVAVVCNEAVHLANRYSDEAGRRMINGILRNLQNS